MSGYKRDIVFRIAPRNGGEHVIVCNESFTDAGGHLSADVRYPLEQKWREDIGYRSRPLTFGYRPTVDINFAIWTMADQHALAQVMDALCDDRVDVYASLDARCTERLVRTRNAPSPKPFGGKTVAGAEFSLQLECVELIAALPKMGVTTNPGQREFLQDGGIEQWTTATNAQAWTEAVGAWGSVNQETVNIHGGLSAARMDRSSAGYLDFYQGLTGPAPGSYVTISVWSRGSGSMAQANRVVLRNESKATDLLPSGSWGATTTHCITSDVTTSYAQSTFSARISSAFHLTNAYTLYLPGSGIGNGESLYHDDLSLVGPSLPDGVSLW